MSEDDGARFNVEAPRKKTPRSASPLPYLRNCRIPTPMSLTNQITRSHRSPLRPATVMRRQRGSLLPRGVVSRWLVPDVSFASLDPFMSWSDLAALDTLAARGKCVVLGVRADIALRAASTGFFGVLFRFCLFERFHEGLAKGFLRIIGLGHFGM